MSSLIAHREGRTRSLQIAQAKPKSLTLYPIELGGHVLGMKWALVYRCIYLFNNSVPINTIADES